ncbi:MAG: hypothetical protein JXB04_03425 [Kiritimatiellae bacterium]|nr:hypothetical protein [Kiritimatiellia bacterium]
MEEERSIAPWVLGGVILGGGAAAAISLSDDDDGGDHDDGGTTPPPSDGDGSGDGDCTEDDVLGTWEATLITTDATITRTITISDGGAAAFEEVTDPNEPGPSASTSGDGAWELDGCTLNFDSPIATMDGSAMVSGDTFTLQSAVYHQ